MKGTHGNCYLPQLAKILMCTNVCHSGFITSEEGDVKCFRRAGLKTDENEQPHLWLIQSQLWAQLSLLLQARNNIFWMGPYRFVNHL